MMKHSHLQSSLVVVLSLVSLNAFADRYPPPYAPPPPPAAVSAPSPDRQGLTVGVGVGAGHAEIQQEAVEADSNLGVSLRVGLGLSQRFLIHSTFDLTHAQTNNDGAMQLVFAGLVGTVYVHPRVFLSGGMGYAYMRVLDIDGEVVGETDDSAAGLLGLGVEVLQSRRFAFSVELRGFATKLGEADASGANLLIALQLF